MPYRPYLQVAGTHLWSVTFTNLSRTLDSSALTNGAAEMIFSIAQATAQLKMEGGD